MIIKKVIDWIYNKKNEFEEKRVLKKYNPKMKICKPYYLRLSQYVKCQGECTIGEESRILCWDSYNGMDTGIKPQVRIGNNFHATRRLTIQCANKVNIGSNVLFASDVFLIDYNHGMDPSSASYLDNQLEISRGIEIEDGVWIGNNVIILGGVTVGKKSIIGAGSVVTRDIPEYCIAVGNPARVIKKYDVSLNTWVLCERK